MKSDRDPQLTPKLTNLDRQTDAIILNILLNTIISSINPSRFTDKPANKTKKMQLIKVKGKKCSKIVKKYLALVKEAKSDWSDNNKIKQMRTTRMFRKNGDDNSW